MRNIFKSRSWAHLPWHQSGYHTDQPEDALSHAWWRKHTVRNKMEDWDLKHRKLGKILHQCANLLDRLVMSTSELHKLFRIRLSGRSTPPSAAAAGDLGYLVPMQCTGFLEQYRAVKVLACMRGSSCACKNSACCRQLRAGRALWKAESCLCFWISHLVVFWSCREINYSAITLCSQSNILFLRLETSSSAKKDTTITERRTYI